MKYSNPKKQKIKRYMEIKNGQNINTKRNLPFNSNEEL